MIEGLKPYNEYKESGQRWLGEIPRHWAVLPLCRVAVLKTECGRPNLELLSVYLNRGVIRYSESAGQVHKPSLDLSKYQVVDPGDFVLNNQQAWRGSIGVSKYKGIISPAYVVLKLSNKLSSTYANALFRSPAMVAQYVVASRGVGDIQRNLYYPDLRRSTVVVPPDEDQAAIVRFLNHLDRDIDGFIRRKRKLIALLKEQKQAIVHRAVTGGLSQHALKASGIPWLGDIPEHWDIQPIKRTLVRMDYGTSESALEEGKIRVLTMGHIQDGRIVIPQSGGLNHVPPELYLENDDLLFNRTNSLELVGKVGLFQGDAACPVTFASYLVRMRVSQDHNPQWLNFLLNSIRFWAYARSHALMSLHQANLNARRYGRMKIPVPPRTEQDEIVRYIAENAQGIDMAIARTKSEIALMQEYRTRFAADVVTGKVDVREAAANLLDAPTVDFPEALAAAGEPDLEASEAEVKDE